MPSDISDFLEDHPPLSPPAPAPTKEAIAKFTQRQEFSSSGQQVREGSRALLEVQTQPCSLFNCPHPPGHHVNLVFEPDAGIDETAVGWTVQHTVTDKHAHEVPQMCILCGEMEDDLREHECAVWARVT